MPLPEEYKVHIGNFDGPMDLLLYVVQKNEVRPESISIAEITDQYFLWMKDIVQADLSAAGDFLLMASRLMELKVRELLPKEEQTPEDEIEFNEDKEALLKQIQDYQRYKQVAKELQEMELENYGTFYRGRPEKLASEEDTLADANIWQLFRAYQKSLRSTNIEHIHHVELDYVTIEDQQQAISNYLALHGKALFEELVGPEPHPILATVTFMALMEMIKTDEVVFRQGEPLGPIWIYRKKNNSEFADEMANETFYISQDPELKPGLLEIIRNREESLSKSKQATIDAVMREAVLWATNGKMVRDEDLMNMLEGRILLTESAFENKEEPEENPENLNQEQKEILQETVVNLSENMQSENLLTNENKIELPEIQEEPSEQENA